LGVEGEDAVPVRLCSFGVGHKRWSPPVLGLSVLPRQFLPLVWASPVLRPACALGPPLRRVEHRGGRLFAGRDELNGACVLCDVDGTLHSACGFDCGAQGLTGALTVLRGAGRSRTCDGHWGKPVNPSQPRRCRARPPYGGNLPGASAHVLTRFIQLCLPPQPAGFSVGKCWWWRARTGQRSRLDRPSSPCGDLCSRHPPPRSCLPAKQGRNQNV